jgi:small conductance mechanosensitive channel
MPDPIVVPAALADAATVPSAIKAALPALTVMLINGAINILLAVLILIVGWTVAGWLSGWLRRILARSRQIDNTVKPLLVKSVRYVIVAITLVAVLSQFGVQTTSVIALLGAAGLAIGLALQGTLSNVASGVMLLILRPFHVGDAVDVSGASGTVREVSLFNTVLITADKIYVTVPNSQIFGAAITNYTREDTRRINIIVGIDYDDDIDKAQNILMQIMTGDERVLKNPPPIAPVNELAASSVNLIARCFVPNKLYWDVYFDMQKAIKLRFDEAGITIPFPQQTASQRAVKPPAPKASA